MADTGKPPPFPEGDVSAFRVPNMGSSYHWPSERGNVRPGLEFISLDRFPEPLHEVLDGQVHRVWANRPSEAVELRWSAEDGFRLSHRGDWDHTRLNGLPIGENAPLSCGDILRLEHQYFRVDIAGERPTGTLEQASWTLVENLLSGGLIVRGGSRGALELELHAISPNRLEDLERSPLAFEVKHLDVVLDPLAGTWTGWGAALGALAGRVEFILPRLDRSFPGPQRLAPVVDVSLDGKPLSLDVPVCLVEEGGRLMPTHLAVPDSPRLYRDGPATVFARRGSQQLLGLALDGCPLRLVGERFVRVLMPGDVWNLVTPSGTQVLRVERATSPGVLPQEGELSAGSFRAVTRDRFVTQPLDAMHPVETFREVTPGRFVSDFGNEYDRQPRFFQIVEDDVRSLLCRPERLLLPAPSPFFAGAVEVPEGGLTEAGLRVFIDALYETGDGAALAFEGFVAAPSTAERGSSFLELLRSPSSRRELAGWAARAFPDGAALPVELRANTVEEALAVLWALARNEPVFGAVTQLLVEHELDLDQLRQPLLRIVADRAKHLEVWRKDVGKDQLRLWPASLRKLNGFWPDELPRPPVSARDRRGRP